jgi:hypothetical protein
MVLGGSNNMSGNESGPPNLSVNGTGIGGARAATSSDKAKNGNGNDGNNGSGSGVIDISSPTDGSGPSQSGGGSSSSSSNNAGGAEVPFGGQSAEQDEKLMTFLGMTEDRVDVEVAKAMLESVNWDVQQAVNQLFGGGPGEGSPMGGGEGNS